jgi:hypothetical protein
MKPGFATSRDLLTSPVPRGSARPGQSWAADRAGSPLPAQERSFFETRLGHDFSRVRVHTGAVAQASARAIGARAYAAGEHIGFSAGRYEPGTRNGRRLLAHELVHVAQQSRGGGGGGGGGGSGGEVSAAQAEPRARAAAERVAGGDSVSPAAQGAAPPGVYCDSDDDEKKKPDDTTVLPNPFRTATPYTVTSQLPPPTLGSGPGLKPPASLGPTPFATPFTAAPILPGTGLSPAPLGPPQPALSPPAWTPPAPVIPPYNLMANADLLAPFSAHGTTPSMAGMDLQRDWSTAYVMFRNYLPDGLAATSANMFLAAAYTSSLSLNQPNMLDKSDQDFKAAYPNDKRTPIVPALSSSSLTLFYEILTKQKNTNKFYF